MKSKKTVGGGEVEPQEPKLTKEQSEELAGVIIAVTPLLCSIDLDYAKLGVRKFRKQANFQDSAAVLNPRYDPDRSKLIRVKADALEGLIQFVEKSIEAGMLSDEIEANDQRRDQIMKMFM